jgi:alpha-D-xyloside xylohydrolase
VRAGSILPYGPAVQYIAENHSDPITLYVYAGAEGAFTLYEDQGTTFDYEKGAFSQIPMRWDDKSQALTLGARTGVFDGMLRERDFQIVLISKLRPGGYLLTPASRKVVHYSGAEIHIKLP